MSTQWTQGGESIEDALEDAYEAMLGRLHADHSQALASYQPSDDTNVPGRFYVDDEPPMVEQRPQPDPGTFLVTVKRLLPDICPEYAEQQGPECLWDPETFLNSVFEAEGNGTKYPRRAKKRKRGDEGTEDDTKESRLQKLQKKYEGGVLVDDTNYTRVG